MTLIAAPKRTGRRVFLVGLAAALVSTAAAFVLIAEPPSHALEPCPDMELAECGTITRLLDPNDAGAGAIGIAFELHLPSVSDEAPLGTIVAVEGGPGFSSTYSRDYYLELFAPLLDRRQLLLVDNRGTGQSAPINCLMLQDGLAEYDRSVRQCGSHLGTNSDVWGTAIAADDLVAVLDQLGIDRVDLYGASYGTFFAQSFAVGHPDRLKTLTLDAAYNIDQDPWSRDLNRAMVDAFRRVCERDPGCKALGGDPIERMRSLADSLAKNPIDGIAFDADGYKASVYVDASALAYLAAVATYGTPIYRELDAAGRSYLENDDPKPLLRIAAEQFGGYLPSEIEENSEGLFVAVSCNDYPQLWDIKASPDQRIDQYEDALSELRAEDPDAFAPFTIDEWLDSGWHTYEDCEGWPTPSTWIPPLPAEPSYPNTPTLVLVGDLDSITSPEGARIVADRFPNSTYVEVANVGHVTAIRDFSRCASNLVNNFIASSGDPGDIRCAYRINEIRVTEQFPEFLAEVAPMPGTTRSDVGRTVTAAAHTVADMIARWWTMYGEEGVGLRGGTFTTTGFDEVRFTMDRLSWVEDLQVSGKVRWNRYTGAILASVDFEGSATGSLTLIWNDWDERAQAEATGIVNDDEIDWTFLAP